MVRSHQVTSNQQGELSYIYIWLLVSNIFYFHPYLGKIPILTNIFQMGWNHQLDIIYIYRYMYYGIGGALVVFRMASEG